MTIAIIDCGSGNLRSVHKAFLHIGADAVVTSDILVVKSATHIVLPGVGAFGDVRAGLFAIDGMFSVMEEEILHRKKPFLGICVGMQLLADKGMEHGEHTGFGWISGTVEAITPTDPTLKIPHMGWNNLQLKENYPLLPQGEGNKTVHPIFANLPENPDVYFVHSYHFKCEDKNNIIATVDYGGEITAAVAKNNIIGVQFHPEKSQTLGLTILQNFVNI